MKTYFSKFYKARGFLWDIEGLIDVYSHSVNGPFCINCKMDIIFPKEAYYIAHNIEANEEYEIIKDDFQGSVTCSTCGREYKLSLQFEKLKAKVALDYALKERSGIKVESLDEIPSQVKIRDQDDKYFIAAKIGEKDGKRVGVVYFGEKNREQNKKDYSQIFIDLDDEQVRFDKSNMPPKQVIAKMKVEFRESIHEENYKKINKVRK